MQDKPATHSPTRPGVVLCLSGHDPSGGAGVQADIEALLALGQPSASLITCLTAQNSQRLGSMQAADPGRFREQADILLEDMHISAIKLGALGSSDIAREAANIIRQLRADQPTLPVVVDPVLVAASGGKLADDAVIEVLLEDLLPLASLATPNHSEAQQLQPPEVLLANGCQWLLLTDTDSSTGATITHQLQGPDATLHSFNLPRLPGIYHGSGCTLASACAGYLALGETVPEAVRKALDFTRRSLEQARDLGHGQRFPNRSPR